MSHVHVIKKSFFFKINILLSQLSIQVDELFSLIQNIILNRSKELSLSYL